MSIKQDEYIVFIRCNTYNHSSCIKDALNSFAQQKTNFPYACVVVDDCSTDGEQSVILNWMKDECEQNSMQFEDDALFNMYLVKHKNNPKCTFAFYLLKKNLFGVISKGFIIDPWRKRSKYEAICEGDDYWLDSNKLQDQVDFLENHSVFTATSSRSLILMSETDPLKPFGLAEKKDYYKLKEIVVERQFHTASVVFRISSMYKCPFYDKGGWDTFQWCCLLTQGPIHYDDKVTCVYRQQNQGVTETTSTVKWLSIISNWADILTDCFVPKYVNRKYVVRSITKGIIEASFKDNIRNDKENKKKLKELYFHNFSFWNVLYDLKVFFVQCLKKILGRQ